MLLQVFQNFLNISQLFLSFLQVFPSFSKFLNTQSNSLTKNPQISSPFKIQLFQLTRKTIELKISMHYLHLCVQEIPLNLNRWKEWVIHLQKINFQKFQTFSWNLIIFLISSWRNARYRKLSCKYGQSVLSKIEFFFVFVPLKKLCVTWHVNVGQIERMRWR